MLHMEYDYKFYILYRLTCEIIFTLGILDWHVITRLTSDNIHTRIIGIFELQVTLD